MTPAHVYIDPGGDITAVHADALVPLLAPAGNMIVRRASNVEPTHEYGANGRQTGPVEWFADMRPATPDAPLLGPFPTRTAALEAERLWLDQWLTHSTPSPATTTAGTTTSTTGPTSTPG